MVHVLFDFEHDKNIVLYFKVIKVQYSIVEGTHYNSFLYDNDFRLPFCPGRNMYAITIAAITQ